MVIHTQFDGHMIILPRELEGHAPCPVEIIVAEESRNGVGETSIWEVVAQSRGMRDAAAILQETSADRDNWSRP
jgi:hypothetical protein